MVSKEIPFLGMLSKSNHDSAEGPWNFSILISFQAILLGVPMIVTPLLRRPAHQRTGREKGRDKAVDNLAADRYASNDPFHKWIAKFHQSTIGWILGLTAEHNRRQYFCKSCKISSTVNNCQVQHPHLVGFPQTAFARLIWWSGPKSLLKAGVIHLRWFFDHRGPGVVLENILAVIHV